MAVANNINTDYRQITYYCQVIHIVVGDLADLDGYVDGGGGIGMTCMTARH